MEAPQQPKNKLSEAIWHFMENKPPQLKNKDYNESDFMISLRHSMHAASVEDATVLLFTAKVIAADCGEHIREYINELMDAAEDRSGIKLRHSK